MATTLCFDEVMDGYLAVGALSAQIGYADGEKADSRGGVDIQIAIDDLDRFIAEPAHQAQVTGKLTGSVFGGEPVLLPGSTFNLFSIGPSGGRQMEYALRFEWEGHLCLLRGTKKLEDDPLAIDATADLTTLFTEIYRLDATGQIPPGASPQAAGILHFRLKNLPALLASVKVGGTPHWLLARTRFLSFFLTEEMAILIRGWKDHEPAVRRRRLSRPVTGLRQAYDVVIVGSGYGGGAVAERLSSFRGPDGQARSVCVLERGREWRAGDFPDEPWELPSALRTPTNPGGLFDVSLARSHDDGIDVLVGNGLGGTSLINANVMIEPPPEVFTRPGWPRDLPDMARHFQRVRKALHVRPHPRLPLKGEVLKDAAVKTTGSPRIGQVDLAVTFARSERAEEKLRQEACNDCGGCVTGCNYAAKNTVDMTYLARAQAQGAEIFTQLEVESLEPAADGGGYLLHLAHASAEGGRRKHTVLARQVIVAAGSLGSYGVLARSVKRHGLQVPAVLGQCFSGNGDVLGLGYNTNEKTRISEGPTITSVARYWDAADPQERFIIEEGGVPRALTALVRAGLPALRRFGVDTDEGWLDALREWLRIQADGIGLQSRGALENSLLYLGMGIEDRLGQLVLDERDTVRVQWQGVADQPFAARIDDKMLELTRQVGGTYIKNPRTRSLLGEDLITVHPLGGCPMGESADQGVVNVKGEVFGHEGGLFVADGSIFPAPLGVNPALTIAALAEHIADGIVAGWQ